MQNTVYFLSWVTALCSLWFIWSLGVKSLVVDYLRERLFELRFELFRLGMSGEVPFQSDAYRSLEILMCGLLRYAHRVSLLTYILSRVEQERAKKAKDYIDVGQQMTLKVSRLTPEAQKKIATILVETRKAIIFYMAFSSLLMLLIMVILQLAKLVGIWRKPSKAKLTGVIEQEAYRSEFRRPSRLVAA
jgi:hypothetical protein